MNFAQTNINTAIDTSDIDDMLMRGQITPEQAQRMKAERYEQQRSGRGASSVSLEKYAGKYQPVKIRSLASTEEKNKAKEAGAAKKRSWAVRGILGAYQAGDLTDPEEIMQAAIEARVNDDPQIFELYASAKQKANPAAGTQDWLPNKDALSEGLDMYMQTPGGAQDQMAQVLKRATSGQLSKEQFGQMLTQNPQLFADFQRKFSTFTAGNPQAPAAGPNMGNEQQRLTDIAQQARGEGPQPMGPEETALGAEASSGTPSRMVAGAATATAGPVGPLPRGKYEGYDELKTKAAAARGEDDGTSARVKALEAQRDAIYGDATMFASKAGQSRLKDIQAELAKYTAASVKAGSTQNADDMVDGIVAIYNGLTDEEKADPANAGIVGVAEASDVYKSMGRANVREASRVIGQAVTNAKIRSTMAKQAFELWKQRQKIGIQTAVNKQEALRPGAVKTAMAIAAAKPGAEREGQLASMAPNMAQMVAQWDPDVEGSVPAEGIISGTATNLERFAVSLGLPATAKITQLEQAAAALNNSFGLLARGVQGERGVLTDQDIKRVKDNLFSIYDSDAKRRGKIKTLREIFDAYGIDLANPDWIGTEAADAIGIAAGTRKKNKGGISGAITPPAATPKTTEKKWNTATKTWE